MTKKDNKMVDCSVSYHLGLKYCFLTGSHHSLCSLSAFPTACCSCALYSVHWKHNITSCHKYILWRMLLNYIEWPILTDGDRQIYPYLQGVCQIWFEICEIYEIQFKFMGVNLDTKICPFSRLSVCKQLE